MLCSHVLTQGVARPWEVELMGLFVCVRVCYTEIFGGHLCFLLCAPDYLGVPAGAPFN